ncbi:MAG TPA: M23 family metallopeptidase [Longimicrobiaceae bacterium]
MIRNVRTLHTRSAVPGPRILPLLLTLLAAGCALPRWPVEAPLISPYGARREPGLLPRLHEGVDLDVPTGTPIRAMKEGRVRFAGERGGWGKVVIVDHSGRVTSVYAHLSRTDVRTGDRVKGRQVVGLSGASGNATTPHLHFEVWLDGRPADPVPLLGGEPRQVPF